MPQNTQTPKTTKPEIDPNLSASKRAAIDQAYKYFLKGLKAWEIAKLLDVSERTVQRWIAENDFKVAAEPKTISERVFELSKKGLSYTTIAKALKVSKGTVYNYMRAIKKAKQSSQKDVS